MSYKINKIIYRFTFFAAFALIVAMTTSCLNDERVEPEPVAYVSFYHASPNSPALSVFVDDNSVGFQNFAYSNFSGFLPFRTGERVLNIRAANASNNLATRTVNLLQDRAYSMFITNEQQNLETIIVRDSSGVPESGHARIRFVHLSHDAGAVRIQLGNNFFFGNQEFKDVTNFIEVPAGEHHVRIMQADGEEILVEIPGAIFATGRVYSLILRGYATLHPGINNGLAVQVLAY